jgi:hypothetical protein
MVVRWLMAHHSARTTWAVGDDRATHTDRLETNRGPLRRRLNCPSRRTTLRTPNNLFERVGPETGAPLYNRPECSTDVRYFDNLSGQRA